MGRDKRRGIAVAGTWVPLGLTFLRSRACAELSPHAAKLLLDLLAMLGPNATKNGDLSLSPKLMRIRGWSGRETLGSAATELLEHGLLVQTRQGGRKDCSLFAVTLYPLDCDMKKLDVGPGAYSARDWEKAGLNPPTDEYPGTWRRARKQFGMPRHGTKSAKAVPPRDKVTQRIIKKQALCPATGQTPPMYEHEVDPPRVTSIDLPSIGAAQAASVPAVQARAATSAEGGEVVRRFREGSACARLFDALVAGPKGTAELEAMDIANPRQRVRELRGRGYCIELVTEQGQAHYTLMTTAPVAVPAEVTV